MVYIRHKVPFTLVDLWKLFLSRLKPRCVKKYLRRKTEYWAELTEAVVTFKEFAEYLLLNCKINVEHRNDSDINAAYDDTEQEKGHIVTDENDKLVPIKKTTQLKRPNGGNKKVRRRAIFHRGKRKQMCNKLELVVKIPRRRRRRSMRGRRQ
jgi:hypothetical protein